MANSPEPIRSRAGGWSLVFSGIVMIALGWWGAMSVSTDLARSFIASATTALAILLINTGRRLMKAGAEMPLTGNAKRSVVYLRMFSTDSRDPPVIPSRNYLRAVMTSTNEAQFRVACRDIGSFIAVGRPGDRLEPLGADRIYLPPSANWQDAVIELIEAAELVIVRAGASDGRSDQSQGGLLWEISSVVAHVPPEKILIFLPYPARRSERKRNAAYQAFREDASSFFPNGLPSEIGTELFIGFNSEWQPVPISRDEFPDGTSPKDSRTAFLTGLYQNYQVKSFSIVRVLLLLLGLILALAIAISVAVKLF